MIHLFHGELVEQSRRELSTIRERFSKDEVITLDGKNLTLTDFKQAVESQSLFLLERLVIIENLFTKQFSRRKSDIETLSHFTKNIPEETTVVFWEENEVPKTVLNLFPKKTDIALFKPDRAIFQFVESLRPKNTQASLDLLQACLKTEAPEMIFTMIVRQFHYLIMAKEMGKKISELSPWQATKLTKQAEYFTIDQLLQLYKKLLAIDISVKTSSGPFNLVDELKLFIIRI